MDKKLKIIDLTHPLGSDIPSWDNHDSFKLEIDTDYSDGTPPDVFRAQSIKCAAGIGTHMDAPAHVIQNGRTIDKLNLEELVAPLVVIDVSLESDENYVAMPIAVEQFEKVSGKIPSGSFVIFYTGWSKYWENREKYHNNHKFPSVHVSTAELLLKRGIVGLGIDTLSADTGKNGFLVHQAILGADKYLVENIANKGLLPPVGAKIFILPIKIKNGTEAPIRLLATLN